MPTDRRDETKSLSAMLRTRQKFYSGPTLYLCVGRDLGQTATISLYNLTDFFKTET